MDAVSATISAKAFQVVGIVIAFRIDWHAARRRALKRLIIPYCITAGAAAQRFTASLRFCVSQSMLPA
jgi:hypothetical protein